MAARGQEILDLLEYTECEVVSMAHAEAGRVRLTAFLSAVAFLVLGVFDVVDRQYPGLEVELVDAESSEAPEVLRRGQVDAALSFFYVDDDIDKGLQAKCLPDDILYLVIHPGDITRIVGDAQCRWVTSCARYHEELLTIGRVNGFTPETAYASDSYAVVQALIAAGAGAILLPRMALSAC